ncbi:SGNH/GDSL hydrolase family protein [Carnobacterium divergens]|uniref:SGNH/GDSL hydrolase family protein n=1 Tax=Carnobacterium divergens TaxID=2748 RepID=UPI0039B04A74
MVFQPVSGKIEAQPINDNFSWVDSVKRDKTTLLTMNDMGQDVKTSMTGGSVAVVGVDAVDTINIRNGAVSNSKVPNSTIGEEHLFSDFTNIFDRFRSRSGYSSSLVNGGMFPSTSWSVSEFIEVNPGDVIRLNRASWTFATTYNSSKVCIGEESATASPDQLLYREFTVKPGVKYIIINLLTTSLSNFMATKNRELPTTFSSREYKSLKWLSVKNDNLNDVEIGTNMIKKEAILYESVGDKGVVVEESVNKFNKEEALPNAVGETGEIINANWYHTDYIKVNARDVLYFNLAYQTYLVKYDENKKVIGVLTKSTSGPTEYEVEENVKLIRINVYKEYIDTFMFSLNNRLPDHFEDYSEPSAYIKWLTYADGSIEPRHLKEGLFEHKSYWDSKKMVTIGTSILWQDGKNYNGTNITAIGIQTQLKENLNFRIIDNSAISGSAMANGSVNGPGTNTTGKMIKYLNYDVVLCDAGTNDFKLNIPIGSLGKIGDTSFDTNTFYGAYRDLIEYILKNNQNIRIVLMTPFQRDNGGYDVNTVNEKGHTLNDYRNAIMAIGEMYSIAIFDAFAKSGLTKLNLDMFTLDGLHPNNEGYRFITRPLIPFINNLGGV